MKDTYIYYKRNNITKYKKLHNNMFKKFQFAF